MSVQAEALGPCLDGVVELHEAYGEHVTIGRGSFAKVVEATYFGAPCAVKFFKNPTHGTISESIRKRRKADLQIHRLLHPNVVQFLGYCTDPVTGYGICLERMYKSLHAFVEESNDCQLPIEYKTSILLDISRGIRYIHSQKLLHRDLKPDNVLLTRSLKAKLADFGMARNCADTQVSENTFKAAMDFLPPEVSPNVGEPQFGFYTDSFSFGCLILYILTYEWPKPQSQYIFDEEGDECKEIRTEIERRRPYIESVAKSREGPRFMPLIEQCLSDTYSERPNFDAIHQELNSYNQNYLDDAWVAQSLQDAVGATTATVATGHIGSYKVVLGNYVKEYSRLLIPKDATREWLQKFWWQVASIVCFFLFVLFTGQVIGRWFKSN